MSAADKTKLDQLDALINAQLDNIVHPFLLMGA
jgi:hypothetical protein